MDSLRIKPQTEPIEFSLDVFDFTNFNGGEEIKIDGGIEIIAGFAPLVLVKRSNVKDVKFKDGRIRKVESITERRLYGAILDDEKYAPISHLTEILSGISKKYALYDDILSRVKNR
tara:strand:+ start:1198 stop:1545 length:348 start_codon:yes stop_codon:yes gene_type:complete